MEPESSAAAGNGPPGPAEPGALTIVGLEGIGSAAALALASVRAGRLVLCDDAPVELDALERSALFSPDDVGEPRARAAQRELVRRFPDLQVEVRPMPADAAAARGFVDEVGVSVLATEALPVLLAVHDAAVEARRPFVHVALLQFTVQVLTVRPFETPCLRCVFGDSPPSPASAVAVAGGLAPLFAFGGALAAGEALRLLRRQPSACGGRMLIYEARSASGRLVRIARRRGCGVCGARPECAEA